MVSKEWLVTDQRGVYAMGTELGMRSRKYHGFLLGIPGRTETAFLSDFEMKWNGKDLWPHRYASPEGSVVHPLPEGVSFELTTRGPVWRWKLEDGTTLRFGVEANENGGIRLRWSGHGGKLQIRPFWAMRALHGMGGEKWSAEFLDRPGHLLITSASGRVAECQLEGPWHWREDPLWYQRFFYSEEQQRGYLAQEDLFGAGVLVLDLETASGEASWLVQPELESELEEESREKVSRPHAMEHRTAALDFVLRGPAGVNAGFPWFGEWGRDTFIALPGIVMAWLDAGGSRDEVWEWAREVLSRWGGWIRMTGMIPNLIEQGGSHQWESSDGTLWWCHSLAALFAFGFPVENEFGEHLDAAIASIGSGRHLFLRPAENGLLEVTEPHSTWMDARIDGVAVTPRVGALPEINALWFQARCLHEIWSRSSPERDSIRMLENLGKQALACASREERERPNRVFLHSIPLAPSFVLKDLRTAQEQLEQMAHSLWTPAGLRTLSPSQPGYQPRCEGDQLARDRAYHQGTPWAWLGGHFEMAKDRVPGVKTASEFLQGIECPIEGHIPEIFDAEPPYLPRGTPAQAWSVACLEEVRARRREKTDAKLTEVLARRWLERMER